MNKELVITEYKNRILTGLYESGTLAEIYFEDPDCEPILGNIYIGKIQSVVKNINAAFVEISPGLLGYYSLTDNKNHIFINSKKNDIPVAGDDILVQVAKENIKTKAPVLTSSINYPGKYLVLTEFKKGIGISNKIKDSGERSHLKDLLLPYANENYGFIVRTNAKDAPDNDILYEASRLLVSRNNLMETCKYKTCFTLIKKGVTTVERLIRDLGENGLTRITTDLPQMFEELSRILSLGVFEDNICLDFYTDKSLPLIKLKNLETAVSHLLKEQVWLKSGAYIVIQPTEAFVVIDVNTGKYTGKKDLEDTFLKINLEAAEEIARQTRLRNLSGILLIDFIDMKDPKNKQALLNALSKAFSKDPVKTVVVDMTALNLVEVTRKKERRPLHEQLGTICPVCKGRGYLF